MSQLESALHLLADDGSGRPAGPDLADRVLSRARQRGRRRGALAVLSTAAAAVLVTVGVTAGLTAVGLDRGRTAAGGPASGGASSTGLLAARTNVLLVGTDATPSRAGIRPDTLIVASIDTRTGDTVLFGLPRSMQAVPFPAGSPQAAAWPQGYSCPHAVAGQECLLNALWEWAEHDGARYYPGDPDPGLTATEQAAESITGLTVDDSVVIRMQGLEQLVDAVGGVTVNVPERLPIGGDVEHPTAHTWLAKGRQRLDGSQALWFARSRWSTNDYDRMARQQCLITDLARQVNASTLVSAYPKIAKALQDNLKTSIPVSQLPQWAALAHRMSTAKIRHIGLAVGQEDPDFPALRREVASAIAGGRSTPPRNSAFTTPC